MDNKIVMISIAAVIGIIVLGSVLMPILDDSTATTDTFTNEGYLPYLKITSNDSYSMSFDVSSPNKATVNGEEYTIWKDGDGNRNISIIMIPDVGIVRYNHGPNAADFVSVQGIGFGLTNGSFSFTYENGSYTMTYGTTTQTNTADVIYAIGNGGSFVLKNSNEKSYVVEDSEIFGMGVTTVLAWNNGFQIEGSNFQMEGNADNIDISTFSTGTASFEISNVADDLTAVSGHEELFTISKVTFTATGTPLSGDPVSVDATYSYFLVPNEVTAERSVHFTDGQNAIFAAMPVMIILAILLGVVALVIRSRMD